MPVSIETKRAATLRALVVSSLALILSSFAFATLSSANAAPEGSTMAAPSPELAAIAARHPAQVHSFIELPSGRTHYQVAGEGSVVVLLHGVSGPMSVWDGTFEALVGSGHRVVRLDMHGRGLSHRFDSPTGVLSLPVAQLEELLGALGMEGEVRLVGSSFGAVVVASEFALRHPRRVASLTLVGPAGFPLEASAIARLREVPLLGRAVAAVA